MIWNIHSYPLLEKTRWVYENAHKYVLLGIIELSILETNFFNLINSKSNQITFFYSVFHAEYEYDIEFHFAQHLVKLKWEKYLTNSDFVEKKYGVATFVLKNFWSITFFFHLIYISKETVFHGLLESVLIFLGHSL
jgi:hypothetical protein